MRPRDVGGGKRLNQLRWAGPGRGNGNGGALWARGGRRQGPSAAATAQASAALGQLRGFPGGGPWLKEGPPFLSNVTWDLLF